MALAAAKQTALEAKLYSLTMPVSGAWSTEAREAALARVIAMGLPTRRDEYWRYTDPRVLFGAHAPFAAVFDNDEKPLFDSLDRLKIVFVDGVFDVKASDSLDAEGIEIVRLSECMQADIHWAKDVYGVLEARGQNPVPRPLAALNTAFASDGICVRVTGQVTKPISMIYLHKSEVSDAILHHVVKVEKGGSATIWKTVRLRRGSTSALKSTLRMVARCTISARKAGIMNDAQ